MKKIEKWKRKLVRKEIEKKTPEIKMKRRRKVE